MVPGGWYKVRNLSLYLILTCALPCLNMCLTLACIFLVIYPTIPWTLTLPHVYFYNYITLSVFIECQSTAVSDSPGAIRWILVSSLSTVIEHCSAHSPGLCRWSNTPNPWSASSSTTSGRLATLSPFQSGNLILCISFVLPNILVFHFVWVLLFGFSELLNE